MTAISGKLTKKLVGGLGPGRHGDGNGLYLVVDPSGARRWIVRVTVKGQKNKRGGPLRTDFGLGGADVVTLYQARDRALEYRRMAKQGLNPRFHGRQDVPTFEEIALQVHIDRMPTWKNAKHGQQWIKVVLDVAKAKGVRSGENPVTAIKDAGVLPKVVAKPVHHKAMHWRDVPAFYSDLTTRSAMSAVALRMTCLTVLRTGEVLGAVWDEFDFDEGLWTIAAERMKTGALHRVPLTSEMRSLVEPLQAMKSRFVFEGQKRHQPLSNMSMLMLLRRMEVEDATVHGRASIHIPRLGVRGCKGPA